MKGLVQFMWGRQIILCVFALVFLGGAGGGFALHDVCYDVCYDVRYDPTEISYPVVELRGMLYFDTSGSVGDEVASTVLRSWGSEHWQKEYLGE